ncbi:hypothetical protein Q3G72_016217 [Acer saccharum]|nr:hypothetical protein Q3G72_016217 [Acer saccharum]
MDVYADGTTKGNVVEPEGMIEIKFRTKELLESMGRIEQELINLKAKLQEAKSNRSPARVEYLQQQIKASKGLVTKYKFLIFVFQNALEIDPLDRHDVPRNLKRVWPPSSYVPISCKSYICSSSALKFAQEDIGDEKQG